MTITKARRKPTLDTAQPEPADSARPVTAMPPRPIPHGAASREGRRTVLLLLEDLGGGTGNHVCRMVAQWSAAGWHVVIVTQRPPLVRRLPPDVEVRVTTHAGWYDRFPLAQLRRLTQIRAVVRTLRPDVVHTYFFWSIIYGRVLKLLRQVPVLVENREDMGFSWGRGAYWLLRMTRAIPDRVVCVAEAVRQVALTHELADPRRTAVIRNGVELRPASESERDVARRQFGFGETDVVIGMVANLPRAVKGGRRLLDAVGAIVGTVPNARFLLVGLGTDRESLEREFGGRGVPEQVIGAGYRQDVDSCYRAMDISVLTSSTEGLSLTLLESMRYGLPTVVTDVGGNSEIVVEGSTGYLVGVNDPAAFVGRVVALARNPGLRRTMGEAGRRRVTEEFAVDRVAQRYLDTYDELIGAVAGRDAQAPAAT